ncbi:hypothetical protein [Bradyrhizobium sp. USDA 336]|uniref:hypothetical protein n=1 Tax=Bradyrhizobium sp. USDA 336 TaxID=3156311 RepID=UPI003834A315
MPARSPVCRRYLPQIYTPDAETERKRRLVARRYQVLRHRTRPKNEVHSILHAHLIPKCPHAELFNAHGRAWLTAQQLPDDERAAFNRHVRELDWLAEDLALLDREIAQDAIGRISKIGRSHARAMLAEAAWAPAKAPGPLPAFLVRIRARLGHQVAAVAVARKLTVLCWHLLTKGEDYLWARPALVANKPAMQLQAGIRNRKEAVADQPMPTTSRRCATARC